MVSSHRRSDAYITRCWRADAVAPAKGSRLLLLWAVLCWSLLYTAPALAGSVKAYLDQNRIAVGDAVTLTIEVTGDARMPAIPNVPGASIQFAGQQTSISSINMSFSRVVSFNYRVFGMQEGTLVIPAIPVEVDGQTLRTRPLQLQVGGRRSAPAGNTPGADQQGAAETAEGDEDGIRVEVELEPRAVYVGQAIEQRLRISSRVPIADEIQVSRRPISGTIEEPLENQGQQRRTEIKDGLNWRVEEARWLFYPASAGPLTVPSMEITVPVIERVRRRSIDPFFDSFMGGGMRAAPRRYATEEQTLTVKPLPQAGRPVDFSGLVGRFTLQDSLSTAQLALGDSITWTLVVEGEGNLRDLKLPPLQSPDFKVYDDTPTVEVGLSPEGRLVSQKTFKRALVPQQAGELTVPPLRLSIFNPVQGAYQTLETRAHPLQVAPDARGQTSLAQSAPAVALARKPEVKLTGAEDILPPHTGPQLGVDVEGGPSSPAGLALLLLPPLLFAGVELSVRARARREGDPALQRRRTALSRAQAAVKALQSGSDEGRSRAEALSRILRSYLGDKLGREGTALTPSDCRTLLETARVVPELIRAVTTYLEGLEAARYAPGGVVQGQDATLEALQQLLDRLEKEVGLR